MPDLTAHWQAALHFLLQSCLPCAGAFSPQQTSKVTYLVRNNSDTSMTTGLWAGASKQPHRPLRRVLSTLLTPMVIGCHRLGGAVACVFAFLTLLRVCLLIPGDRLVWLCVSSVECCTCTYTHIQAWWAARRSLHASCVGVHCTRAALSCSVTKFGMAGAGNAVRLDVGLTLLCWLGNHLPLTWHKVHQTRLGFDMQLMSVGAQTQLRQRTVLAA